MEGQELGAALKEALKEGLEATAAQARAICPVETGKLRDSIGVSVQTQGSGATGSIYASAPYAAKVEMGGSAQAARPFLYPAYKANAQAIVSGIRRAAIRAILGGQKG